MTLSTEYSRGETSFDRVWNALDAGGFKPGKRRGDSFTALCPVHGDTHPSLSVRHDRGRELTMVHCFTCSASHIDIANALGLTAQDLFDRPLPDRPREEWANKKPKSKVSFKPAAKLPARLVKTETPDHRNAQWSKVTSYVYAGVDGEVVQEVAREVATVDGKSLKRFTQRFINPSTGRWVARKPTGFEPVLYHHADIVDAVKAQRPIWLVEGEKDADNATAIGLTSTTNAQGAGSFPDALADVFRGGIVHVIADQDAAGYKRAVTLHELLTRKGATVRLFLPALDNDKADLTDHLEAGLGVDDLEEISAVDATALSALGDARKSIEQLTICKIEAEARMALSVDGDSDAGRVDAEIWAAESEKRYRKVAEIIDNARELSREVGTRGRRALEQLVDVAAEAAAIARLTHQTAGVRIPKSIPVEKPVPASRVVSIDGDGGDGGRPPFSGHNFQPDDDGSPNIGTRYDVRDGETVLIKREKDGDGERNRYHRVIRGWGVVQSISVDDDGSDSSTTRVTHDMIVDFYRWVRDDNGRPEFDENGDVKIEHEQVRWDADQIRDGSWAQALPWPGMLETTSRRGKESAWDALHNALPSPSTRTTVYTTTGWRESDAGPFFVHPGGAIAKGGNLPLSVDVPDAFSPFKLPEPTTDAAVLREAWLEGATPLADLPARVMAPLLGVVWESVFERVPMILHFQGGAYSAKTSTARLGCQFFAPELNYHGKREIFSGANMGATTIGLIRALSAANNLPVLIDDVAPDGDVKRAQKKLSELARLIYNGTGRVTGKQRGGISTDSPPKATVITTGEMGITGSGLTRMVTIPLDRGVIPDPASTFARLEKSTARNARGLLGSSLIQWIAQHRDTLRQEQADFVDDTTDPNSPFMHWKRRVDALPHDEGLKGRLVEGAMAADHGIKLMLRMLVDHNAITRDEANAFYAWAEAGIFEAISIQDSSSSDPAEQLLQYVRDALSSGAGHLTSADGSLPADAETKGWISRGGTPDAPLMPSGTRLGFIKMTAEGERVYLIPSACMGVAHQIANRADATFEGTTVSVASSMASRGWIRSDKSGKRAPTRRLGTQVMRVWDIPLAVLLGDESSPDVDGTDPENTPPAAPTLFDGGSDITEPENPTGPTDAPSEDAPGTSAPTIEEEPVEEGVAETAPAPTTKRSSAPAARTTTTFRAAVAVLHTDGLWLPTGENLQLDRPLEHLGDVAKLIHHLRLGTQNGKRREDGQLLVTREAAVELGIPLDQLTERTFDITKELKTLTAGLPFIARARDEGWNVGGTGEFLNATTRVWSDENRDLRGRFVMIPALKGDFAHLTADGATPLQIARRLQKFADALQYPYAVSAATTGVDLMQHLRPYEERKVLFAPSDPVEPALITTLERDINWTRQPSETELTHTYVHAYDRGASYLAGVGSCEMGIGQPTYFPEAPRFDKKLPGYWRIPMPERAEWLTPNPLDPRPLLEGGAEPGALTWVSTPTLEVAIELGYEPEIHEAYIWEKHSRILDTWYQRVSNARELLDTDDVDDKAARNLLKTMYVESLGLMGSHDYYKGRPGYAPERYHAVQARARANIMRRIIQIGNDTGRWPLAIMRDTVLYSSNEVDPEKAWPGDQKHYGRRPGQYKYERSALLADHSQYLNGEKYRGKEALDLEVI